MDEPSLKSFIPLSEPAEILASGLPSEPSSIGSDLPISHRPKQGPLSIAQQQVWLEAELMPARVHNRFVVLERSGPLDRQAFEQSFKEIIRRHEILRTSFGVQGGTPFQAVDEQPELNLQFRDLSGLPEKQRQVQLFAIAREQVQQPFNLAQASLMRACLVCRTPESHTLLVVLHALVADDWSLQVLTRELNTLYPACAAGYLPSLSHLTKQYMDYVAWQTTLTKGDMGRQQVSYWREQLAGISPVLELPIDRHRPAVQRFHGAVHVMRFSPGLSESLKKAGQREGVTTFVFLLSALQVLLWRYTAQDDIVTGAALPARDGVETEDIIGPCTNLAVIRTDLAKDPTVREVLGRVKYAVQCACEHQLAALGQLIDELQVKRDPSRNPLFQVLFSYDSSIPTENAWKPVHLDVDTGVAKVDLQLQIDERPEGIIAEFIYNTDLFDASTISRMAGHFQELLQGAVADLDQHVSGLPILAEAERRQLLLDWNCTQSDYPRNLCVHQLFEAQALRTPDATAVLFESECLSYRELDRRANKLAHYLRRLGVGPDVLVGVCVERSLEMVVALLGILKAGGAYVPLDPAYPQDRISFMLEDAAVPVLLTQERVLKSVPVTGATLICLDTGWSEIAKEPADCPASVSRPDNLAYVIYTSGSTGKPKGVQIPHAAVVNFLSSMRQAPGMGAEDRILAVTTLCFDIAGLEIYLPLSTGASLEIVSREVAADGNQLLTKLATSGATVMQATPATWRMLIEAGWQGNAGLKVLCGGEAVSSKLANQLRERAASVWNMYGPTETTIWSTVAKIESAEDSVLIGHPIANTQIFILDKTLRPVPVGVAGELHIGGEGLARGYLNRPDLTAAKFIRNPFAPEPEGRIYKTGDLARYRANGDIEFLGRIDHQVKIRGFRIELGEIEAALRQHPAVNETVVVDREDIPGDKRLVAYLVPASEPAPGITELRSFLKQRVPEYMLPSAFVMLPRLPLTPNGKVNRRALPAPDQSDLAATGEFVAPTDAVESELAKIWESLLAVRPMGVTSDFFELGGHSLLAVRLMHQISVVFGKKLPLATLLQAPTIEHLAAIIRQDGWAPRWSCLVRIQAGEDSKPPFFCIHGAGGVVIRFHELSRHLGVDQPVYGLQAQGLDEEQPCHTRVEDMAARYLEEIRSVQPHGPYYVGGYSFGGLVAFEIARQLSMQGEDTALVVLFDTFCIPPEATQSSKMQARRFYRSVSSALLDLWRSPRKGSQILRTIRVIRTGIERRWWHMRVPGRLKSIRKACEQAARNYVPREYAGRVILFRSSRWSMTQFGDPYQNWSRYVMNGLETHQVQGNHDNILLEPQVRFVAEQLRNCLGEAQANSMDRVEIA